MKLIPFRTWMKMKEASRSLNGANKLISRPCKDEHEDDSQQSNASVLQRLYSIMHSISVFNCCLQTGQMNK